MLHKLLLLTISTQSYVLYSESFTTNTFTSSEGWELKGQNQVYSDCNSVRLFGGYDAFGKSTSIIKLFQLPPHHTVVITLDFWKIDTWNDENFFIYIDQILSFQGNYEFEGDFLCGLSSFNDKIVQISITQPHNFQSLFILMTSDLDSDPTNESWGIRNFKLFIYPCPNGCLTCISTDSSIDCKKWDLIENSLTSIYFNSFNFDGWKIEHGCQATTIPLLGGFDCTGRNSKIYKTIDLSAHREVKIKFRFMILDRWNLKDAYFYVDNTKKWEQTFNFNYRQIQDLCGVIYDDIPFNYQITMAHTGPQITLLFTTNLNQDMQNESFGIRDIQIFIDCPFVSSFNDACRSTCGNGVIEQYEECDDGNIYAFDGCFNCQYSCLEGCSNCIKGFCFECDIGWSFDSNFNTCNAIFDDEKYLIWEECDDVSNFEICKKGKFIIPSNCLSYQFGICYQCMLNYELINNKCESICQNQLIVNEIQCVDNNLYAFDRCHQCTYDLEEGCKLQQNGICIQCQEGWKIDESTYICTPICGNLIVEGHEECDISEYSKNEYGCQQCKFQCQNECTDCQFGICYNCNSGWKLSNQQCLSDCGDNQIQGFEECDDMNQIRFDGCHKCRNDCQRECSYCQKGICLDCIYGWHLNDYFQCQSECGDSQIALISLEECDDSNNLQFDGCYECKSECCSFCTFCLYGFCYDCQYTFTLIDQFCLPICGDGLITIGYEQCDDMNEIPYDGCYNCNYQCRQFCKLCIKGVCYDQCEYGYYAVDNLCYPICGDGITVEEEECDDQNDGCLNCFFTCPDHCEICVEGKCKVCEYGYELITSQNQCVTFCGDGLVSLEEECDDMNKQDGDGCSQQCRIEINYVCKNYLYSFTQCTYEKYPRFQAALIRQDYQIQFISLHFDQKVKNIEKNMFSEYIEFNLIGVDQEFYNITLIIVQEALQDCTYVEYIVEISINTTLSSPPILEVTLMKLLYNENEAPLINQFEKVKLNLPKYVDDKKKQSAQVLKNIGTNIMKSIGGIGIFLLLLGNSFKGIIEILQQQSYLKYINVVYPINLLIYFESSNIITLQPLLDFFDFNQLLLELMPMQFVESKDKFKFYEINADLLYNIQAQIFLILTIILMYIGCIILIKKFISLSNTRYFYFGLTVAQYFVKIQNGCFIIKRECEKEGLNQFIIANCWDLLFMSFLQISSSSFTTYRSVLSIILGYLIIYTFAIIVSNFFFKETKQTIISSYKIKKFNLLSILKKFLFVGILVLFQKNQQIQSILLALICNFNLIYIIQFKQFQNKFDYLNLIIMESSVFIFCLMVAFYWDLMDAYIDYENQILLGWFHISILLSVLIINLGLQLYTIILKLKKNIQNLLQLKINQNSNKQKDPLQLIPLTNIMELKL